MTFFGPLFLGFFARSTLLHTLNNQNLVSNLVSEFLVDRNKKIMIGYLVFGQVAANEKCK